jgi:hypothetical protein
MYDPDIIITSTTEQPEDGKTDFLQRVLEALESQNGRSTFTTRQIAGFIIYTATGLFDTQEIAIHKGQKEDKKSPLEIFRESIQNIVCSNHFRTKVNAAD